jgi:hypothetical protein
MNIVYKLIYGSHPREAFIKRKAHLFTLLAVLWSAFSLIGVIFFRGPQEQGSDVGRFVVLGIWGLHIIWTTVAVYFWITEKPKRVLLLEAGDADGDF